MSASRLTIDTQVPTIDHPATPVIIIYDNGDWEIAFSGDVDYITETSSNFFCNEYFINFFVGLMIYFDLGDVDDLDVSGDTVILFLEEPNKPGSADEPVLVIWDDGQTEVMARAEAEGLMSIDSDAVFNFIPADDLFEDFAEWSGRASVEEALFSRDDADHGDEEEDD